MVKRELIDRNNLEITPIATDDYSGNKVIATVLLEDVEKAPVITEQEIVKPYLEKLKAEIENLEQGITSYHNDRPWVFTDEVLNLIDNLLSEQEMGK